MPIINCPYEDCQWQSDNLDGAFAAVIAQQLSMHDKAVHSTPNLISSTKVLKIDPPKISVGATPEEWQAFGRQWSMYKTGTMISPEQTATALFYCCSEELRLDIMRDIRLDVASMPENDLLKEIKRLAVRDESILVHRMKLSKMIQTPGMGIRTFLANLRGQASLCKFTAHCLEPDCTHTFDYSSEIIKDNLIRGISDPEILADLLGDVKADRTLEEIVTFIAQKEQGKATRNAVGDCAGAIHQTNNQKANSAKQQTQKSSQKCWACGGPSHGQKNDKNTRSQKCPAWTATCNKCNIKGHFNKSCSKCTECGQWGHRDNSSRFCKKHKDNNRPSRAFQTEDENSLCTDQLAVMNREQNTVEHHVYKGKWIQRPSKPHPTVIASLTPLSEEHASLGHQIPTSEQFLPQK